MMASEAYAHDLPEYVIEVFASAPDGTHLVQGQYVVGPDGTVNLGPHGSLCIAGDRISTAELKLQRQLGTGTSVAVKIGSYNSKVFYLIYNANGSDQVIRLPYTGTDNVLDALTNYREGDLSNQNIWISRPRHSSEKPMIIPIDFDAITVQANPKENYQLLPGDRLFVSSKTPPTSNH